MEIGTRIGSGAAGSLLAQLGAEVVAVEPPQAARTNKWRHRAKMVAGKKSIVLDRARPDERTKLGELVDIADVVLLSSDVDEWQAEIWANDRSQNTIICDITSFGHSGPLAGTTLPEGLIEALSGIIDTTGQPNETPSPIGTPLLEMHAALYAASAVVAAHRVRRQRGVGQKIDVALFDVGATSLINFLPFVMAGKNPTRSGNRHPLYAPWNLFDAADGSLLICAVTDQQWQTICRVMGKPELAQDTRFATAGSRLANRSELDAVISSWTKTKSVHACEEAMLQHGIACGPVLRVADVQSDPNVLHRHSVLNLRPGLVLSASPLRGSPVSGLSPREVPEPGADTAAVLDIVRGKKETDCRAAKLAAVDKASGQGPFEGVRIVEIGQYTVAPMATRTMGALGADVIKVESPLGDATRNGGLFRSDGASYIFALSNTDKRGIVLDLRQRADCELLHRLLDSADVLIENLKPGSLAKLGFSSEALREKHPHLIYCSVSGFGTESAYSGRPALDTVIQAMSGLMDITRPDGKATKAGVSASDNLGGQFALLALCAAIELRDRTGIANHFDLSMQDATLWATQFEWNATSKHEARPAIVHAADGYVAMDEEGAALVARRGDAAELTRAELIAKTGRTFAAAPVLTVAEVIKHPQFLARQLLVKSHTQSGEAWDVFSLPFKMLGTPGAVKRVMGRLGETDEQVRNELGCESRGVVAAARPMTAR